MLTAGRGDHPRVRSTSCSRSSAEQVTDDAELHPTATAVKHPNGAWDFVVRDGAFSERDAGGRILTFRVRPMRDLGFPKLRAITSVKRPGSASDESRPQKHLRTVWRNKTATLNRGCPHRLVNGRRRQPLTRTLASQYI